MKINLESTTLTTSSFNSVIIADGIRYAVSYDVNHFNGEVDDIDVTDIFYEENNANTYISDRTRRISA